FSPSHFYAIFLFNPLNKVFEAYLGWVHWYKQTAGDTLKLIVMTHPNTNPDYGPGFTSGNFNTTYSNKMSNLTIWKTSKEDEGMYHCGLMDWLGSSWNGSYLLLTGILCNSIYIQNRITVIVQSKITLQCSLVSQTETETCAGDPSVFWFRTGSDKNSPDVIYSDGKMPENCEKTSNTQKKYRYNFSKNINSSDVGTYYCAVATCKEIFLGNGTRIESGMNCFTEDGDHVTYAALHFFTETTKKRELKTEESVYSNVRELT
uniref:Ig-like domain-containing protein n=1 Tax=Xiphophorus couchianus TaxID=32473 RepID=A0A3B5KMM6_9TELE